MNSVFIIWHIRVSKAADELTPALEITLLVIYASNPPIFAFLSMKPAKIPLSNSVVPTFSTPGFISFISILNFCENDSLTIFTIFEPLSAAAAIQSRFILPPSTLPLLWSV